MLPAFIRATQDPFAPARGAALMAFSGNDRTHIKRALKLKVSNSYIRDIFTGGYCRQDLTMHCTIIIRHRQERSNASSKMC
jgi:hypothetical protein